MTHSLKEKEAALQQHIGSSTKAMDKLLQQVNAAKAAQTAMKQQVEKLEASQVCATCRSLRWPSAAH